LNFPAVRGCSVFLAKNHRENGAKPKLSFVLWFSILRDMVIFFSENGVFFFGLLHSVGSERAQATSFTGSGSSWPSGLDHMTP
jgi:hypothetical protein